MSWLESALGEDSVYGQWANKLGFGPGDHSNDKSAKALIDQIIAEGKDLKAPDIGPVNLTGQNYVGDVKADPIAASLAGVTKQGNTNLNDISVDPRLKEAQMRALSSMQGIVDSGGMTAEDTANLRKMQTQVAGDDAGRRNAILQNMQERGLGGSGMELLNQLTSSQASTDREAQQGLDLQGMAQQRALQAMMQQGQMSGQMRDQDFGEQAKIKAAQDAIDQLNTQSANRNAEFNAGQTQGANQFNSNQGFQAGMSNRGVRQDVANANTGIANQQTMTNNVAIPQQNFDNQRGVIQTKQNSLIPGVNYYSGKQTALNQEQGSKAGSTLGAAGSIIGAIYGGPKGAAAGGQIGKSLGNKSWQKGSSTTAGEDSTGYSNYAAHGGVVPGHCSYGGDNRHNDTVSMMLSPGEVVVPRSIAQSPSEAMDFLKHPPSTMTPDKHKEAMLSALKNLHKRRAS